MAYAIAAAPRTITAAVVTSRCILLSIITYNSQNHPWLGQLFLKFAPSQVDVFLANGYAVTSCNHEQDVLAAI